MYVHVQYISVIGSVPVLPPKVDVYNQRLLNNFGSKLLLILFSKVIAKSVGESISNLYRLSY